MLEENNELNKEQEENKELEVKEEKVEEVANVEQVNNEPVSPSEELNQRIDLSDEEEFLKLIDINQKNFTDFYKKTKRISNLFMAICLVVMIGAMFLGGISGAFIGIAIGFLVVYFVVVMIYSKKTKNKLNEDSTRVIEEYFTNLDSFITRDEAFKNVKFKQTKTLDNNAFSDLRICKNVIQAKGRDYIEGECNSFKFVAGDNCVTTREENADGAKKDFIVFLGKLFIFDASLVEENSRAVIYLKGKGANGPTDVDDLTKQENALSDKYDVYSNFDVNTILTDEIKEYLEKYEVNDHLVDMFITFNDKKFAFGFSYDDGLMIVPLLDPVNKEALSEYKKDVDIMVEIVKHLNKKED